MSPLGQALRQMFPTHAQLLGQAVEMAQVCTEAANTFTAELISIPVASVLAKTLGLNNFFSLFMIFSFAFCSIKTLKGRATSECINHLSALELLIAYFLGKLV